MYLIKESSFYYLKFLMFVLMFISDLSNEKNLLAGSLHIVVHSSLFLRSYRVSIRVLSGTVKALLIPRGYNSLA